MTAQFWQKFLAAELPIQKSRALIEALGSSISDPIEFVRKHPLLTDGDRRRMDQAASIDDAQRQGVRVLEEADYPELLMEAVGAPPACFVWGDDEALRAPCVAIVGTRSATTYGKACAQKFAEAFAEAGVTVVSGGALGIDAAAHKGALAVGGRTVAVLATGVETAYPAVHRELFERIRERGALVSQFAIGSRPNEYKFLVRNHLVAAMSAAVVVIEAPARSGAIRTAVAAAELGREVFVVPANISMLSFQGSFNLIRDGATLVDHPDQVLSAIDIAPALRMQAATPVSSVGEQILGVLGVVSISTERIVQQTGLDTSDVLMELTMLELDGKVIRDSVGYALRP